MKDDNVVFKTMLCLKISLSIPVRTLSPICSSAIGTAIPVSRETFEAEGKHLGGGGGALQLLHEQPPTAFSLSLDGQCPL